MGNVEEDRWNETSDVIKANKALQDEFSKINSDMKQQIQDFKDLKKELNDAHRDLNPEINLKTFDDLKTEVGDMDKQIHTLGQVVEMETKVDLLDQNMIDLNELLQKASDLEDQLDKLQAEKDQKRLEREQRKQQQLEAQR